MTYPELSEALAPEISLSPCMIEELKQYAALLKEWNQKMNLTSIDEESEVIEKHFLDSLIPAKSPLFKGNSILDVGTGAGFPGLVLAIAFPDKAITLVDATAKKCTFLQEVVKDLKLKNVTIINSRAEDLKKRDFYDITIARAVAPLNELLEILAPFTKVHGTVVTMKSMKAREELLEAKRAISTLSLSLIGQVSSSLPLAKEERMNLYFKKNSEEAKHFPRPWSEIHSHPL